MTVGQRIRELRLKKGITQIQLAQGLVTPSMISQIESDRARPSFNVLFAIADRLEVPFEKLLSNVELNLEYTSKRKLALSMCATNQHKTAIPLLEELLDTTGIPIAKVDLQFDLGVCYLGIGEYDKALSQFEDVFQWAIFHQDHERLAVTLWNIGKLAMGKKEYQIALFHSQRSLEELEKVEEIDPSLRVKVLAQIGEINQVLGKVDEAVKFYEQSLSAYDEMNDLEAKGQMYLRLAQSYHQRGDYEKVEAYATKAQSLLEEVEDKQSYRDWHHQLSLLKLNKLNWEKTVLELLNLATLYEHHSKQSEAGNVYADVAYIYLENDEIEEAWEFAEKAHLILNHNDVAMGKVNRVLAFVFFKQGDQEKGSKYLDNAITIFEQHGRLADYVEAVMHIGHYLSEKGRHKEAFERIEKMHDFMVQKLNDKGILLQ